MSSTGTKNHDPRQATGIGWGVALSIVLHVLVIAALMLAFTRTGAVQIVAAGPGEGGEGGGGSIEIGLAEPSAILGFAKPQPTSFIGDEENPLNNSRVEQVHRNDASAEDIIPENERDKPSRDTIKTDRPVTPQQERIYTGKDERGRSAATTAQVGRSFGNPMPSMIAGIGIGQGGGFGSGTGLPGGSEYGRRIQLILSRNYNPPSIETAGVQYVIIRLRIARDGRIASLSGGRVAPAYVVQRSQLELVNRAAERAIIASDPLPPFPSGFLSGSQEAVAEVWFRYPK